MSAYGKARPSSLLRPWRVRLRESLTIVLAALLCGTGLFALTLWLTFFNWLLFLGVVPVIVGALLFFRTLTGPDSAE